MTTPDITAAAIEAGIVGYRAKRAERHGIADPEDLILANEIIDAITAAVEAAVPVLLASHEKQVREKVAEELVASAPVASVSGQDLVGPRATLRRHLLLAARRVVGPMTTDEVAAAIKRGAFAACYLDEAGRPIARGSRPAADGGGGE